MDIHRYTRELQNLLRMEVDDLSPPEKVALVRRQALLYEQDRTRFDVRIAFAPFVPGRRSRDEMRYPGLGSSEAIGILGGIARDTIVLLYRLSRAGQPAAELPAGARLLATLHHLDRRGGATLILPGWQRRPVEARRQSEDVANPLVSEPGATPEAWALQLDVEEIFGPLRGDATDGPFGFRSMFFERFRLDLELEQGGTTIASDSFEFEVYDESRFGSLYSRIANELIPFDMQRQLDEAGVREPLSVAFHPWFPVLCIGMEKADLYMKAIRGDVALEKRMLTDPAWLLRVGLYLELLTCLGIVQAVKNEKDLLTPAERAIYMSAPEYAEVRKRVDARAWCAVWDMRQVALTRTPGFDIPVGVTNLLRKRSATLGFLHAHHEDLKQAIQLAGPNLVNAQETWMRVFRDAERAVLKMNRDAFPELSCLNERLRSFVLWHRQGSLAGLAVPAMFAGPFGDQDGLFPSACRQYRASMNHVAEWAAERDLMEYTGKECVPESVSLLENYLLENHARLDRLQRRDGYQGTLDVVERGEQERSLPLDEVAQMIGRISLFQVLTRDEVERVAQRARPISLGPSERIIVQGRKGSSLFVVYEGELEVVARDGANEDVVAQLGRGAIVGEMAFLTGQSRSATVRAIEAATVLEIAAADLEPVVRARPVILDDLTRLMEERHEGTPDVGIKTSLFQRISAAVFGAQSGT
jgi:hypothetical protein